ncbi:Predicted arabinose efflux permease, MFS family [Tranquillimonas rosea]|uniref:Predicted arabinose efflux permease, MFS family n=1 Tax=Tranquillimonas rosea TaxID=641238 RepID=A0A1H9VRM9_9RHOB|nr:MFS transporter [Tranquillimonas rosea]SES24460.1 Predicted arabinose efflux permease, MFS family [Tranquillimonas rosea]
MVRQILPISALLLGSAFLLFAGGINALILPVRGSSEGFSAFALGLLGTGWALGYVSGCLATPGIVARVGHIRAFSVMATFAAISILASLILVSPASWIIFRGLAGFCFAGAAMIVESWLGERAEPSTRGRIFGLYTMVNLVATTAGQMTLTLGDPTGYLFFVLAAMFYCLSLVPTALTTTVTPKPLVSVRLDLPALWRNSPVAVFAVFMVGLSNAAFGTLAPVYGERVGLVLTTIALFASVPILAGALAQIPVGLLSDRMDRRKVLLGVAVLAVSADLAFLVFQPEGRAANLALSALLGAAIFAMYPVIVAHANDHAAPNTHIQVSGGLLLVFGLGSIVGPLLAGWGMSAIGTRALFATTIAAHGLIIAFTLLRLSQRAKVAAEDKTAFMVQPVLRASTPQTAELGLPGEDDTPEAPANEDHAPETQRSAPEGADLLAG